jgi:D-alanyl-D-alanine carboxypeptidase (penicillin-binding protein 5/6)
MRPPDHWHLRQRRRQPLAFTFLAAGSGLFLVLIVWLLWPSGSHSKPATVTAPIAIDECAGGGLCVGPAGMAYAGTVAPPIVRAAAAVVDEEPCGVELYAKDPDVQRAPASVTKLATALVAVDRASLDERIVVDVNSALLVASSDSTVMGLEPGQRVTMRDLLYGLLLPSGNDAAVAIAENVGGTISGFVDLMNLKARELSMTRTHFANPHGLDEPGLYTTARDMIKLGRAALANPDLAQIVATTHYQPSWDGPEVWNSNELLQRYPGEVIGVKIGYTEGAQQTMVAAVQRAGRRLLISVLGSPDRYADVSALFEWAFANTAPAC